MIDIPVLRLLAIRREHYLLGDYKTSDFIRNQIVDEGIKVEDIPSRDWLDNNFDPLNYWHNECKDLEHCLKHFDHHGRNEKITNKFNAMIRHYKT